MNPTAPRAALLQGAAAETVPAALAAALDGGPAVAPLPDDPQEQQRALDVLRLQTPLAESDVAAVVLTSGSTGDPKGVVLSRAAVRASARATHRRLGGPGDWVLALPVHYVAGLMVLARAHLAGTRVDRVRPDLANLPQMPARPGRRRYLSLVPTQLARALDVSAATRALTGFDTVLLGGGPCPEPLLNRARAAGVTVVTTYGMSETCGGCVYDGVPLDGVDVGLDPTGRVSIGGPSLFSGYRLRPDLNGVTRPHGRWPTADRGVWKTGPDGVDRLQILGRLDDVVISGGLNVDLAEVERRARSWPCLDGGELVVIGLPHPEWGTEVVAIREQADRGRSAASAADDGSGQALRAYLRSTLPGYAVPRRLVELDRLPRTSSGKVDRPRLRDRLNNTSGPGSER